MISEPEDPSAQTPEVQRWLDKLEALASVHITDLTWYHSSSHLDSALKAQKGFKRWAIVYLFQRIKNWVNLLRGHKHSGTFGQNIDTTEDQNNE